MTQSADTTTVKETVVENACGILNVSSSTTPFSTIIDTLADGVIGDALSYTGLENTETNLTKIQHILVWMLIERYNTVGVMGLSSTSVGGVSESSNGDYSQSIKRQLNQYKKLKVVG